MFFELRISPDDASLMDSVGGRRRKRVPVTGFASPSNGLGAEDPRVLLGSQAVATTYAWPGSQARKILLKGKRRGTLGNPVVRVIAVLDGNRSSEPENPRGLRPAAIPAWAAAITDRQSTLLSSGFD
ncbi:uncharacterized protein LOC143269006 [Peromyscus maniculatus bairdii]|uniref:uncharacterized protein LOC143269006 n=1 Tax=Peromyscus maniculatus bairdii TaxID=230844 RepID=UPI003FD56C27